MLAIKVIAEGIGLGLIICLYCVLGIRKGAVGLVHLYSKEVRERVVMLGMTTENEIKKREKALKAASALTYLAYVLICVCIINGAKGFATEFCQIFGILEIANLIDRLIIDEYWGGHSGQWVIPGTEDLRPYISSADKKKKWIAGTFGFAVIAAAVAGCIRLFVG